MPCETMPVADRTRLAIIEETNCGITPDNPEFQLYGFTGESLSENRGYTTSNEIKADRNISDASNTSVEPGGTLDVEWRINALLPLVLATLQDDGPLIIDESATISVDATAPAAVVFTATAGDIYADIEPGYFIKNKDFSDAGNDGLYRVSAKADDNTITAAPVEGQTPADETDTAGAGFTHVSSVNGTTTRSFTIQKSFDDMDTPAFFKYRGSQFTTMTMTITNGALLTGSFGVLTKDLDPIFTENSGSTYLPASEDPILDAVNSVGQIRIDGEEEAAPTTSITLNLNNESRGQQAIGTAGFVGVAHGRANITGTVTSYFYDIAQYQRYKNQEKFSIDFPLEDDAGNQMVITLPRVLLTGLNSVAGAINTDIMATGTIQALKDDAELFTIRVTTFETP